MNGEPIETPNITIGVQMTADKNELVLVERFQPEYKVNFVISEVK